MITLEMIKTDIAVLESTIRRLQNVVDARTVDLKKAESEYINDIMNDGKQATYNTLWNIVKGVENAIDKYERRVYALKELADTFTE